MLATLIDTGLVMHERFVRPLGRDETEAYYEDMRRFGLLFGLSPEQMPATVADLRAYVEEMSTTLRVSDEARESPRCSSKAGCFLRPPLASMRQLTAGLLHPALRDQFGLSWGPTTRTGAK